MMRALVLGILLPGCESDAEVAAEMERALSDSNTALLGALFGSELLVHLDEPPTTTLRHSTASCGCPCLSRVGTGLPFVLTEDYASLGCIPQSGLLPTALSGHLVVVVDDDGSSDATWQDFEFALEFPVSGAFSGAKDGDTVHPAGELVIGDTTLALDLDVQLGEAEVRLDGKVTVTPPPKDADKLPIEFHDVVLPREAIGAPCPRPSEGTATLPNDNPKKDTVVHYDRPGDGFVIVSRDERESEETDYCAYASELW
jgi:hypothetical protein